MKNPKLSFTLTTTVLGILIHTLLISVSGQTVAPENNKNISQNGNQSAIIISSTTEEIKTTTVDSTTDDDEENSTNMPEPEESFKDLEKKIEERISADIDLADKDKGLALEIVERDWDSPGWLALPPNYNKNEIPNRRNKNKKKPYRVAVFLSIRGVNSIDTANEQITLDIDSYTFWADRRFHWNHTSDQLNDVNRTKLNSVKNTTDKFHIDIEKLHPDFVEKIWIPDVIIENTVIVPHNDLTSEPLVSFNSFTGFVRYKRIEVKSPCSMNFFYYPMDIQKCEITLRSYKYLSQDMDLHWVDERGVHMSKSKNTNFEVKLDYAAKIKRKVKSVHFPNLLERVELGHIVYAEKSLDVLKFVISFRRNISFHLSQSYLPSGFFILITWLFFLLPPSMAASRVALTMTALLTINTMFNSVREHSPQVAYAKAIDVWMTACVFFAFLSLAMFTLMSWLETVKEREEKRKKEYEEESKKQLEVEVFEAANEKSDQHNFKIEMKPSSQIKMMNENKLKVVLKVRKLLQCHGLTILTAAFVAFNAIYWSWICTGSGYFVWTFDPKYNEVK